MRKISSPSIWLITLIAGLPQLSEAIYDTSLPKIALVLQVSESIAEYTLTSALFGFAIGILFWGKFSDQVGRKFCVLSGLFIFIIGCVLCYFSTSILLLMVSRFIQAFGGSIGIILAQTICNDVFHGTTLSQNYSIIGRNLAIFTAIGPFLGTLIVKNFSWNYIFLFLIAFAIFLTLLIVWRLPETYRKNSREHVSIFKIVSILLNDKKVWSFVFIVAFSNGIYFSYFAEGPFYLELLGLSTNEYNCSFVAMAVSIMFGGIISKKLHDIWNPKIIMKCGIIIILVASGIFSSIISWHMMIAFLPQFIITSTTIVAQMSIMCGICIVTNNALALALINYKWCIGTALSLFGFFYYTLTSFVTLGMGFLHNDTLLPMPLYFFIISIFMLIVNTRIGKN